MFSSASGGSIDEEEVDEQSSNSITVFCSCAIMSISHFI